MEWIEFHLIGETQHDRHLVSFNHSKWSRRWTAWACWSTWPTWRCGWWSRYWNCLPPPSSSAIPLPTPSALTRGTSRMTSSSRWWVCDPDLDSRPRTRNHFALSVFTIWLLFDFHYFNPNTPMDNHNKTWDDLKWPNFRPSIKRRWKEEGGREKTKAGTDKISWVLNAKGVLITIKTT